MDALKLLKQDHRDVKALFRRFERAGEGAHKEKRKIVEAIIRELSIHAAIEEEFLYPVARQLDSRLNDTVLEALEEHHVAKATLAELDKMRPEDERYEAKVTVLMENIKHHIEEEEEELFPRLSKVMGADQLKAVGAAMAQAKKTAPTHPHPMAPDTPPGIFISGALAAILDRSRDAVAEVAGNFTRRAGLVAGKKRTSKRQ